MLIFLTIQKSFPEVPTSCLENCLTLETKILRSKGVLWNLQLLRRQLFCSNRTSFSSSADVDLYRRMGLSSLCSTPNNNCQPDINIKPYVHLPGYCGGLSDHRTLL